MKPSPLDALMSQLKRLQELSPEKFAAVVTLVDYAIRDETITKNASRGVRQRLLSRLQAIHECRQPGGGGFEQLEPAGKVRQWRCLGCQRIVTLD